MAVAIVDTPIGPLCVVASELGVARVDFGREPRIVADISVDEIRASQHLDHARVELAEYFDGTRREFSVALDRSGRRGFRGDVLAALEAVPYGSRVTYGDLATMAGRPRAFRAVGTSMGLNPIAVIVPCHRVVRAGGELGQYGGGVRAKRWLLDHEGEQPPI